MRRFQDYKHPTANIQHRTSSGGKREKGEKEKKVTGSVAGIADGL
jgi:hypothetical protein